MSETNTVARAIHDVTLGVWFGGTLMGAIGLNAASREIENPSDRIRSADAGWAKWTPIHLTAIAAHLASGVALTAANRDRLRTQHGVARLALVKAIVTGAAVATTAYSRMLGKQIGRENDLHVRDAVTPGEKTPPDIADAQRRLKAIQWIIPAETGALIALASRMGEQQRPAPVATGMIERVRRAIAAA